MSIATTAPLNSSSPRAENTEQRSLRVTLVTALVVIVAVGLYMSWGALYDLALDAGGMPPHRAIFFPIVIDLVTVVAMLLSLLLRNPSRKARAFTWSTLAFFGALTVAGNAAEVATANPAHLSLGFWVGTLINAVPAIAMLVGVHLASVTVFTSGRTEPVEVAAEVAPVTRTRAPRTSTREVATDSKRAEVAALREREKLSYSAIAERTGVPKSTVIRWTNPRQVAP
jgi:hypothetical protein